MKTECLKSSLAAKRKAHFSSGGTLKTWRGAATKLDETKSKAEKNKNACRNWEGEEQ